ncbi:MAG: dTMP kinase [Oligoflexia bacterium]|nr:dTMP kinase [Oligoflexia bacterium]
MPFITFEGIDGSGKSSLAKLLAKELEKRGYKVQQTQEPGGTALGLELRQLLLRTSGEPPCPEAELLIYEADRAQHVNTKIKPLLKNNFWVLSDRFYHSSLAFQGAGRDLKIQDVMWLNQFAAGGLSPDLVVLVDCPVDVSFARRAGRVADRFEKEKREFHEKVRNQYLKLAKDESDIFLILESEKKSLDSLLKELIDELNKRGLL